MRKNGNRFLLREVGTSSPGTPHLPKCHFRIGMGLWSLIISPVLRACHRDGLEPGFWDKKEREEKEREEREQEKEREGRTWSGSFNTNLVYSSYANYTFRTFFFFFFHSQPFSSNALNVWDRTCLSLVLYTHLQCCTQLRKDLHGGAMKVIRGMENRSTRKGWENLFCPVW